MLDRQTAKRVMFGVLLACCVPGMLIGQEFRTAGEGKTDATGLIERPGIKEPTGRGWRTEGPDMTFCQLYGLAQSGREEAVLGLSVATTAWNIGDEDLPWSENHPFIVMNLFRLETVDGSERLEQIGQSWAVHGFYALGSHQCGGPPCTYEPGHWPGEWLGTGCTDTHSASLNAAQNGMGPRCEVNPWLRTWACQGWHPCERAHEHDAIQHRLQVNDAALDPAQNPGAAYYAEGYCVCPEDIDQMNSAGWKPVTVSGSPGGTWSFGMTGPGTMPEIGFAIDAWPGATQTILAEEVPVVEFVSPDGRCVLAAEASDLGGGLWHYEYALLNVDMDRKAGSFTIPVSLWTSITNIGFHAVEHHGEEEAGYSNDPWTATVADGAITWSTVDNPVRWGTLYNFRFDADAPPHPGPATITLGLFEPGDPVSVTGLTTGPCAPNGDMNADGETNGRDVHEFVEAVIAASSDPEHTCPGDFSGNGVVDLADVGAFVTALLASLETSPYCTPFHEGW